MTALLISTMALACECVSPPPPCQAVGQSDLVFLGTITEITEQTAQLKTARMSIDRSFKGDLSQTVELFDDGMCDGPELQVSKQYLMYTSRLPSGALPSRGCTRSRPVEHAVEDLKFLDLYSAGKTLTQIYGAVRFLPDHPDDDHEANRTPLKDVEVTLTSAADQLHATTNVAGQYSFLNLAPGDYKIDATLPGHSLDWAPETLRLDSGGCAETTLLMKIGRRIEGTVRQKDGTPVSGVLVELVSAEEQADSEFRPVMRAISDDEGDYSVRGVAPGTYHLGVNIESTPTKEHPYPTVFYPNTQDRDQAVPITVWPAASVQRFDLQVSCKLSLITIKGAIKTAEGNPPKAEDQPQLRIEGPDGMIEGQAGIKIDTDGQFELELLEGLKYSAFAFSGLPGSEIYSASVEFIPTRADHRLALTLSNNEEECMNPRHPCQELPVNTSPE